jgi:SAM-dependent methyltransferase
MGSTSTANDSNLLAQGRIWSVPGVAEIRAALRIRQRLRPRAAIKSEAELRWWIEQWDPALREGGFNPPDVQEILCGEPTATSYEGRRWQQARAEVLRVLIETEIEDRAFFDGKVVLDIGPGPLGFPDACPARVSIGVEPLAQRFAEAGLMLQSNALYLPVGAESIPLTSSSVDVVTARNSLDHVDDPEQVVAEARRLLRVGGVLLLNFDVDHAPTDAEPHTLSRDEVRAWLAPMTIVREIEWDHGHAPEGHAAILVARA